MRQAPGPHALGAARFVGRVAGRARDALADALQRAGVSPDAVSWAGFALSVLAVPALLAGASEATALSWFAPLTGTTVSAWPLVAGLLLAASGFLDVVDGALARRAGRATPRGAFLDSTLDRLAEAVVHLALVVHFAARGSVALVGLTTAAFAHGMLIAYMRSRAEALGPHPPIGFWQRSERHVLLVAGLMLGVAPATLVVLGIFPAFTALRRFVQVQRLLAGVPESEADAPLLLAEGWQPWRAPRGSLRYCAVSAAAVLAPAALVPAVGLAIGAVGAGTTGH